MRLRVGGYARQHDFDRDRAIEQRVMRAIDRAHAALAEQFAERVFAKCLRQCALRGGLCDNACWQYTMGAFSAAVGCWVTRVTWSPAAGRFGGLQTLQESFFFARAGRQSRLARAKQGDLRGRQAAPKPPPRKSCWVIGIGKESEYRMQNEPPLPPD